MHEMYEKQSYFSHIHLHYALVSCCFIQAEHILQTLMCPLLSPFWDVIVCAISICETLTEKRGHRQKC